MIPTASQSARQRELGLALAVRSVDSAWIERALGYVREFSAYAEGPFLTEQVREFAHSGGLAQPANAKVWGAVMRKAQRQGIVRAFAFAPARSSNGSPKVLWRATP